MVQGSRLKTQGSRLKTQDARRKTQDARRKTQRLKVQGSRRKTQDARRKVSWHSDECKTVRYPSPCAVSPGPCVSFYFYGYFLILKCGI